MVREGSEDCAWLGMAQTTQCMVHKQAGSENTLQVKHIISTMISWAGLLSSNVKVSYRWLLGFTLIRDCLHTKVVKSLVNVITFPLKVHLS